MSACRPTRKTLATSSITKWRTLVFGSLLIGLTFSLHASADDPSHVGNSQSVAESSRPSIAAARTDSPQIVCRPQVALADVAVTDVRPSQTEKAGERRVLRLRDEIEVTVKNLDVLLNRQECSKQHKKIVLYLEGRPLPDRVPYPPTNTGDPAGNKLKFILDRKEESRDVWSYLLGHFSFGPRNVEISVGMENEYAVPGVQTYLQVVELSLFIWWLVLFLALAVAFLILARKTNLLRDVTTPPARRSFSLARVQIAFWFFIVLASYLLIGIITGDFMTSITGSVLGLLGISSGTAIGSSLLDTPANTPVNGGDGKPHWYLDILSDQNGVNFHRFQMAAWTLVLGIIFVAQVYASLAMPAFDNTLLALLGISSGTYLGLKSTAESK